MSQLMSYPLSGVHLIDASAGTGKTYTISSLYVRLLLERSLAVRQILVVTYTKAATEDLRIRVRQMLRQCLTAFETGQGKDDFEKSLLLTVKNIDLARKVLVDALQNFDEAAIFTIHGFCQRMLKENSLESGALFDTELLPDLDDLLFDIAADFWRRQLDRFPPSFLTFAQKKLHPQKLFFFLKKMRPGLLLLPEIDKQEFERITSSRFLEMQEQEVNEALDALYRLWPDCREQVGALLSETDELKKTSYRPEKIKDWLVEMDIFCRSKPSYDGEIGTFVQKLASSSLAAGTKNKRTTPSHPFFDLCQRVCLAHEQVASVFTQLLIGLQQEAARFAALECPRVNR